MSRPSLLDSEISAHSAWRIAAPSLTIQAMRGRIDQRPPGPEFGRVEPDQAGTLLGIMSILHSAPLAPAFGRLLKKGLEPDDYVQLAHVFEEISVLALHHLIPEGLLFDAFAFDLYWDELREDVRSLRMQTGNEKLCENFEIAADRARDYRRDRPPKMRWHHKPEGDDPTQPPGGGGHGPSHPPSPPPEREPGVPAPEPAVRRRA